MDIGDRVHTRAGSGTVINKKEYGVFVKLDNYWSFDGTIADRWWFNSQEVFPPLQMQEFDVVTIAVENEPD